MGDSACLRQPTPHGHILFVSTHDQPFGCKHQAFTLDASGGMPQPLRLGRSTTWPSGRWDADHRPQHRRSSAHDALPRRHRQRLWIAPEFDETRALDILAT